MKGLFPAALSFWRAGGSLMPALLLVSVGIWYLSFRLYLPLARSDRLLRVRLASGRLEQSADVSGLRVYERGLGLLRALVAAAPLLGLLGTVKGMISTFITLGQHGTTSMEWLSVGLSEALITTQVGLVVALPGLVGAHASARALAQVRNGCERLIFRAAASRVGSVPNQRGEGSHETL